LLCLKKMAAKTDFLLNYSRRLSATGCGSGAFWWQALALPLGLFLPAQAGRGEGATPKRVVGDFIGWSRGLPSTGKLDVALGVDGTDHNRQRSFAERVNHRAFFVCDLQWFTTLSFPHRKRRGKQTRLHLFYRLLRVTDSNNPVLAVSPKLSRPLPLAP